MYKIEYTYKGTIYSSLFEYDSNTLRKYGLFDCLYHEIQVKEVMRELKDVKAVLVN